MQYCKNVREELSAKIEDWRLLIFKPTNSAVKYNYYKFVFDCAGWNQVMV